MKSRTFLRLCCFVVVLIVAGLASIHLWPLYQEYRHQKHEKALLEKSLAQMKILKKAVESYVSSLDNAPQSDILLEEMLLLAETDLSHGQWDSLGVYTTPNFVYLGGCYGTWCYVEANRRDNSYSLYMEHKHKRWVKKLCTTQGTPLGKAICTHLKSKGWEYREGEM